MTGDTLDGFFESCPGLLFVADTEGNLLRCSSALQRRFARRLGDRPTLSALAEEEEQETIAAFLAALGGDDAIHRCSFETIDAEGQRVELSCEARRAPSASIHGKFDLRSREEVMPQVERALFQAILDTLDVVLWAVKPDGTFVFHDGKGLATAGLEPGQFLGMDVFELYPPDLVEPIREALEGRQSHYVSEAHGVHWESWNLPLKNESGEVEHCAGLTLDVSERVRTESELKRQLETIQSQQQAIHQLSAPVINVWDEVLTVPLIGTMDQERAAELSERLLGEVHRTSTRFAILDLTGVESLDTGIAGHVISLLNSLRLLGVEGLITGVSPQVAQTMVGVGIEFREVSIHRSLREGLRYCMRAIGGV